MIVVGHPGTGVKEQAAGLYARHLAERGFVTLAFDAAYQGESAGEPRGLEDPAQRVEDVKAAVSFLTTRDEVDPGRIGVLGICASGGYALPAAATDHRVRAVATVSAVDIARQFRDGADGAQDPTVIRGMLEAAAAARTAEARGEDVQTFALFPDTEEEARRGGPHVFEGWEYYRTPRAGHPRSAKSLTWTSVDRIVTFDAFRSLGLLGSRPLLLIALPGGGDLLDERGGVPADSRPEGTALDRRREPRRPLRQGAVRRPGGRGAVPLLRRPPGRGRVNSLGSARHREAAADAEHLPGDVGGGVGGEEQHGRGDLFRTSCGRRNGMARISASLSFSGTALNSGVSVGPGHTQLTLIRCRAISRASDLVSAMTPPLAPA